MSGSRRVAAITAIALAVLLAAAGAATAEVAPGDATGGSVSKAGWWWQANDAPENPVAPLPPPPAPNIPEGALPVAAAAGDPEKVTAIEFVLESGPGATVTSAELALRQAKEPGANVNADGANTKVVACPMTEAYWIDGPASPWNSLPAYDCDLGSAEGKRGSNGVWTFDLTSIASSWLSATAATPPSVVLVEKVEAPESFQVTFDGIAKEGIGFNLVATGGGTPTPPPPPPVGSGDSGAVDTGTGAGAPADAGAPVDAGAAAIGDAAPGAAEAPAAAGAEPAAQNPQTAPISMPAQMVSALESIPGGAFALVPIVLALAYAAMLALGPNGEPALATARHGVGRALERMRAAKQASKGEL